MRDVNNGWLIRYLHSNTASAFFFIVYLHIGRGMYYGSYRAPRTLVWTIGTVIFILMMATIEWPNWLVVFHVKENDYVYVCTILPFNKTRTRAIHRVGPHNIDVLSIIICGMLGDWWGNKIKGAQMDSVRFSIEQGVKNSAYVHFLNVLLFELGYCSSVTPKLLVKSESKNDKRLDTSITRFNYRLTIFSFTSLLWIYDSFYHEVNGVTTKRIPAWIGEFITPLGLAHLVMQIGSLKEGGLILYTKFKDLEGISLIKNTLKNRYNIDSAIIYENREDKVNTVLCIRVESIPLLRSIIHPYMHPSLYYILETNTLNTTDTLCKSNIVAVTTYTNSDEQKQLAVKENRGKSGIYRWINKKTGHSYVGSSINLSRRFNQYYNYNHIADPKRNMRIDRALLKYGQ